MVPVEDAKSTLRSIVAYAIAEAVVPGFDEAEQHDKALRQKQMTAMVAMGCMAYADAVREGEHALDGASILHAMRERHGKVGG
jgi:hypothetical protein